MFVCLLIIVRFQARIDEIQGLPSDFSRHIQRALSEFDSQLNPIQSDRVFRQQQLLFMCLFISLFDYCLCLSVFDCLCVCLFVSFRRWIVKMKFSFLKSLGVWKLEDAELEALLIVFSVVCVFCLFDCFVLFVCFALRVCLVASLYVC